MEHFFSQVNGVVSATAGYANGNKENPTYKEVYTDTTGFAETVEVCYDPERAPLSTLLEYYFTIIDPLSLNRQGEDVGTRYRTGIYYTSDGDLPEIDAALQKVQAQYPGQTVVVEKQPLRNFYPAEDYHQKYLDKNPDGYCHLPVKTFVYLRVYQEAKALLQGESDQVAKMAEIAALLQERLHFFWTGFYLVKGEELLIGPFQGPAACMHIPFGKGVCGTAWKEKKTIVVEDVEKFPGHIACSSLSRSEIVVPVFDGSEVSAVLDIDSKELSNFDGTDAAWLELIVRLL